MMSKSQQKDSIMELPEWGEGDGVTNVLRQSLCNKHVAAKPFNSNE